MLITVYSGPEMAVSANKTQLYGQLGSRPNLSPILPLRSWQLDQYQIILLGVRGTCV